MTIALALLLALAAGEDPCRAPEYHGLDFWLGAWSVHSSEAPAESSVEPLGAGCAVLESYRETGGYRGQSLNYRDPQDARWHQVWIDSAGAVSEFAGTPRPGGGIDFEGTTLPPGGSRVLRRMSLSLEGAGNVRQRSWLSRDAGATWLDHYSLEYRPSSHASLAEPCRTPGAPEVEARVRAAARTIVEADNARALERVLASYARDAVLLPPAEAPVAGGEAIRERYERLFAGFDPAIEGRVDTVCVAGPVALVLGSNAGRLRSRTPAADRVLDDEYRMVLRDAGGAWRISVLLWRPRRPASPGPE